MQYEFQRQSDKDLYEKTRKIILTEFNVFKNLKRLKSEILWFNHNYGGDEFSGFVFSCARVLNLTEDDCFKDFLKHHYNDCCEGTFKDPVSKGIRSTYGYISKKSADISYEVVY